MSNALDSSRAGRLRELDGWRAVSVLLVIGHHIAGCQHRWLVSHFSFLDHTVQFCGPLGVKIFFVISGFVICRLLISEEFRYGSVSLLAFYYRRIFRILPPLFVYLGALYFLLSLGLIHECRRAVLDSALFLYDINLMPHSWFVGHTWSLAVEEQFYLIFPALWVLIPRRRLSLILLGILFSCAAWNLAIVYVGSSLIATSARAGFACISCGVLMAIHEARLHRLANSVPAFIVALVACMLLLHPVISDGWLEALYESLLVPPAIALVLLFSLGRGGSLRAFLLSKPLQAIGVTSYGIYLWQQLFTAPKTYFLGVGRIIPLLLPLLCLIVPVSYFLIEKPLMDYGRFLSRQTRKSSIDTESIAEECHSL